MKIKVYLIMKRIYLASLASILFISVFAQTESKIKVQTFDENENWYRISSVESQDPSQIIEAISEFNKLLKS